MSPKNRNINCLIDQQPVSFNIQEKKLFDFDPLKFYSSYPHVYFKPKDADFEIYASGCIYFCHHHIEIASSLFIPFFTIGSDKAKNSWDKLGNVMGFIPQKFVIISKNSKKLIEIDAPNIELDFDNMKLDLQAAGEINGKSAILKIKEKIEKGSIEKCVFAQVTRKKLESPFDLVSLIDKKIIGTKYYLRFSKTKTFLGITPEWIYKRSGKEILIDAIAGTASLDKLHELETSKIISEFNFVKEGILESINPIVDEGSFQKEDQILLHHNLAHRFNPFKGILKGEIKDRQIIQTLHPTPAISGYPRNLALIEQKKHETFERGLFASPVGFYSTRHAFIAVAIRSMMIDDLDAYLFSGAGIVKDSDPKKEWQELMNKLSLMSSILA